MAPTENVVESLISEYPFLAEWGIRVERRFDGGPGRLSNAYLIACRSPADGSAKRFVAKYGPWKIRGVVPEWRAQRLALANSVPTSALLLRSHRPIEYLLTEFLEGQDGESATRSGVEVFGPIGDVLRQLHRVQTPGFGDLDYPNEYWAGATTGGIMIRLEGLVGVLEPDLHAAVTARIDEAMPAYASESSGPRLIHRDVYLSNFIIDPDKKQARIIDFAMACGGPPLYDLAKFFILDLYRFPDSRDAFLSRYFADEPAPVSFKDLMTLYLYVELLGMLRFFNAVGQTDAFNHAKTVLTELVEGKGRVVDLIS